MRSVLPLSLLLSLTFSTGARADFEVDKIYVCDFANNQVHEVDPITWSTQVVADSLSGLNGPAAIQFTASGRMLVSNFHSDEVLELDDSFASNVVLTAADGLSGPGGGTGICIDRTDQIYISNHTSHEVLRFAPDYTGGIVFADSGDGIGAPDGMFWDANGNAQVASVQCSGLVVQLDPSGAPSVYDVLFLEDPQSVAVRANGDVYILCESGNIHRYLGGDPANRVLLGTYGVGPSKGSIQLDPTSTVLYHVNAGDGALRTIDPDTGAEAVVVNQGWDAVALAVVESQFAHGSFQVFGQGTPGNGAIVPTLRGGGGLPLLNTTFNLEIRDFVGGALAYLVSGDTRTSVPIFGGELYIDLNFFYIITQMVLPGSSGVPGDGDVDVAVVVPSTPALLGLRWNFQTFAVDPAAQNGINMTNGLAMKLGR